MFCVALLLVCLDGLGEENLSFSETLSNGMASVTVMLSPLFVCAPTADCGCHVTCCWNFFYLYLQNCCNMSTWERIQGTGWI